MYIVFNKKIEYINEFTSSGAGGYFLNNSEDRIAFDTTSVIGNFEKINFFVGANNSGKSRFLRGLFKLDLKSEILLNENACSLIDILNTHQTEQFEFQLGQVSQHHSLFENENATHLKNLMELNEKLSKKEYYLSELAKNYDAYEYLLESIKWLDFKLGKDSIQFELSLKGIDFKILQMSCLVILKILSIIEYTKSNALDSKFYIPTLRSLTRNSSMAPESFKTVVRENYKIDNFAFTGLEYFDLLKWQKSSQLPIRKKIKEFENFLSKNFFENGSVEITSSDGGGFSRIYFSVEEEEFPIHDIGDGIQQLIILLFPIFTCDNNTWVFIEEPETHLHPGLQRVFIDALLNDDYLKTKNLRYFFTTHSNHFLDLSIGSDEISVFQFQKENTERFLIQNKKPGKDTLELLGVNTSSVFLANCSIWVEGPTDRKYLSTFLKLYCESKKLQPLREDIDFAFFEYGGNLIEHYLFDEDSEYDDNITAEVNEKINAFALCNKIYLLADNDNASGKKAERRKKLQSLSENQINFKYQNTVVKEIENLLPVKILKDFIPQLINQSENGLVNFKKTDYSSVGLGKFFHDKFSKAGIVKINKFKSSTGETLTALYKNKLCDFVVNGNFTYSDLIQDNPNLEKIVEGLYSFIKSDS